MPADRPAPQPKSHQGSPEGVTQQLRIKILSCLRLRQLAEVKQKAALRQCCALLGRSEWQELARAGAVGDPSWEAQLPSPCVSTLAAVIFNQGQQSGPGAV